MIGALQMLRGVAATLVVLFHLQAAATAEGFPPGLLSWFVGGEAGVDVFFVLSGFVIFHAVRGRTDIGAAGFLRQRFWRIVPPYWAVLFLTLLAIAGLSIFQGDWSEWPEANAIAASLLLLPVPQQVMSVAWTLTIECLFYLLFAATYFRFGTRGAIFGLVIWALVAQVMRFLPVAMPPGMGSIFYSGVIEFLYGGLIAVALASGWKRGASLSLVLGATGLILVVSGLIPLHWGREWVAGLPAAALVYGLVVSDFKFPNWTMVWGESSYILYLVHILVFSIAGTVLRIAGVAPYGSTFAMLALAALAVLVSVGATVWLERPYRRWTHGR